MSVVINGSAGVTTNSGAIYDGIQRATSVTASGTSVDFTNIPSWVKRITVMISGVSTNGTSNQIIQLGTSGGFTTSGYVGQAVYNGTTRSAFSSGFMWSNYSAAGSVFSGIVTITNLTSNTWTESANVADSGTGLIVVGSGGNISLASALTQIRITTVNGTDTFDAGSINILYE